MVAREFVEDNSLSILPVSLNKGEEVEDKTISWKKGERVMPLADTGTVNINKNNIGNNVRVGAKPCFRPGRLHGIVPTQNDEQQFVIGIG